jgi:hypothetical protein
VTAKMRRRAFITLIGGAAAAWPLVASAQQPERMRRIGVLMAYRPSDPEMQARVQALQQELQRLEWTKGVNIQFDERWTTDDMELVRAHAVNLVELNPDVIVTNGGRVVPIFIQPTRSIPIIIPGTGDPVSLTPKPGIREQHRPIADINSKMARARWPPPSDVSDVTYYGVSPYIAFSWPWANARAGGMSILPPMISIYAPALLARAAFIASSSSPSVVTRAVNQSAQPSAFGNSA